MKKKLTVFVSVDGIHILPYEDHRVNPAGVLSAMPPSPDILYNYVVKLKNSGVDLSFLPNNGAEILGETTQSATTEGPVVAGVS